MRKGKRKSGELTPWAVLAMLALLGITSSPCAEQPAGKPQPESDCPPQYAVCLTADEYAEVTGTVIELRTALRKARLDIGNLKAQAKGPSRWTRYSIGPSAGIGPEYRDGIWGFRTFVGVSVTWDWWQSK